MQSRSAAPASAVPSSAYRTTLFDRQGPDAGITVRSAVAGVIAGVTTTGLAFAASMIPPVPSHTLLRSLAAGVVTGTAVAVVVRTLSERAGGAFLSFLQPSGATTPAEPEYSRLEALAARGDMSGALAGYEVIIAAQPGEAVSRLRAAELYVQAGDARRAEALLREVQSYPARTDAHDLRASNRLVDLYLGPLAEPGRALRELRRLADTYAGTPMGDGARDAIARLKTATV